MRELLDILAAAEALFERAEPATLATVVHVEGSSYRLPGARMLIDPSGRRIGSVSGGCLEADVARRGRMLTPQDTTSLVRYDGSDEDVAWGFGLGCNGSIQVLIERHDRFPENLEFILQCFKKRVHGAMVTVFSAQGEADVRPGARFMFTADDVLIDKAGPLHAMMRSDVIQCLSSGESATITYEIPGGSVQVLVEAVIPPLPLVIFGAGHDAVPLVRAAKSLGWHVTLWDRRAGYARADRFPEADLISNADPNTLEISADTAAVVMTHHYPDDRALLPMLLQSPARYIGMLGPRARTDRMLAETAGEAGSQKIEHLDRLHAPIGLDIGAQGAEQVAVAIVAEILSSLARRPGGPLRQRAGPIHTPAKTKLISGSSPEPAKSGL